MSDGPDELSVHDAFGHLVSLFGRVGTNPHFLELVQLLQRGVGESCTKALRASIDAAEWAYDLEELIKGSGLCKCSEVSHEMDGYACLPCDKLSFLVDALNNQHADLIALGGQLPAKVQRELDGGTS